MSRADNAEPNALDDEICVDVIADAADDAKNSNAITGSADDSGHHSDGIMDRWTNETQHHGARRLFRACPWTRQLPILGDTIAAFGPKFTASIGAFYFMNNGLAENIIASSKQPMMMKRYQIDATRYQRLSGVVTMGSSIKVLMATISDTFAIFGYRKRWYQLGSSVVGFAFCLGYALLPARPASADVAAAFIFLCTFCRMNSDILTQGYYSRLIRRTPKAGPQLVTWVYWMILSATLVAAVITGPLADQGKTVIGIFVSAVMHLLPGIIFLFNGYSEKTNQEERLEDARMLRKDVCDARRHARLAAREEQRDPLRHPSGSSDEGKDAEVHMGIPQAMCEAEGVAAGADDSRTCKIGHHGGAAAHAVKSPVSSLEDAMSGDLALLHDGDDEDDDNDWDRVTAEEANEGMVSVCNGRLEINREMVLRNWRIVCYSALMVAAVVTMACTTILGTTWDLLWASIAVAVACIGCAFICLPRVIAKTEVAVFLDFILYIQLPGALDSFYVADEACLPGGPHFSYSFYTTVGAVIQNIAGVVGVTLFAYVFSKHSFQMVMVTTVIMRMIASIFDLIIVQRWNLAIGIPDHAMYICGDSIITEVCAKLNYMPLVLVLSRVCPRGSESMVYALMSSIGNLGMTMSNTVGSLLMELLWPIDTQSTPCNFDNVRWLIICGHLVTPVLIIPVSYIFLPRARMCDDIDMNGHAIKKQMQKEAAKAEPVQNNAGDDGVAAAVASVGAAEGKR